MRPNIHVHYFENKQIEADVKRSVLLSAHLLPVWVDDVHVFNTEKDDDFYLQAFPVPHYREIKIEVSLSWSHKDERRRVQMMRHELAHAIIAPMTDYVFRKVIAYLEDKNRELYEFVESEFRDRMESVTQELVFLFDRVEQKRTSGTE